MNNYSKKVMNHFLHPRNVGHIKNYDGIGKLGNPRCGDIMEMTIKVKNQKSKISAKGGSASGGKNIDDEIINDIKFQTFGCGAAVATSSMLTEMVKGKTIAEAEKITARKLDKSLGNLPPIKKHCAFLAENALKATIKDYKCKITGNR